MKQTAVEWLAEQLSLPEYGDNPQWFQEAIQQAKQIEREQLIGLLQWMNNVAGSNPMALETDNEDIVEMYLNGDYEPKTN